MDGQEESIFLRILIPMMAGIFIGLYLPPERSSFYALLLTGLLLFAFFVFLQGVYLSYQLFLHRWVPGLIVYLFLVVASAALAVDRHPLFDHSHYSRQHTECLFVKVSSQPRELTKVTRFEGLVLKGACGHRIIPLNGKILVSVYQSEGRRSHYKENDVLLVPSDYTPVAGPLNPYEFNYKQYLAYHGIFYQIFVDKAEVKELPNQEQREGLLSIKIKELRSAIQGRFNQYIRDRSAAAVASSLILGNRENLDTSIVKAYTATGVIHILSVSGMHVALVMLLLSYLLWFLKYNKSLLLIRAVVILLSVWLYVVLTGSSAPACRAATMLTMVVTGRTINRKISTANSVAASAVVLLLYNPYFLLDIGFQLSYLAVFGLVYCYPPIYGLLRIRNKMTDRVWSYAAMSISAQLVTFPLCLFYFNLFPLYFLFSNLLIALPVAGIMYAGVLFILIPLDILSKIIGVLLEKSIFLLDRFLELIANLPYATVHGLRFGWWYYSLIYISIYLVFKACSHRSKKILYVAIGSIFLLMAINSWTSVMGSGQKRILFYSVYKHMAIGFFNGKRAIVVSDVPVNSRTYDYSLAPVLSSRCLELDGYYYPGKSINRSYVYSDGDFYQFNCCRLLIWKPAFNRFRFQRMIAVDFLMLDGNPSVSMTTIHQSVKFNYLLISGNNSDYRIKKWREEMRLFGRDCYVLKKSEAREFVLSSGSPSDRCKLEPLPHNN